MISISSKSKVVVAALLLLSLLTVNHTFATQPKGQSLQAQDSISVKRSTLNELLSSLDEHNRIHFINKLLVERKEFMVVSSLTNTLVNPEKYIAHDLGKFAFKKVDPSTMNQQAKQALVKKNKQVFLQGSFYFSELKQTLTKDELDDLLSHFKITWNKDVSMNRGRYNLYLLREQLFTKMPNAPLDKYTIWRWPQPNGGK